MMGLDVARPGERLTVLCLGAHSDDIEIGAGGLQDLERGVRDFGSDPVAGNDGNGLSHVVRSFVSDVVAHGEAVSAGYIVRCIRTSCDPRPTAPDPPVGSCDSSRLAGRAPRC